MDEIISALGANYTVFSEHRLLVYLLCAVAVCASGWLLTRKRARGRQLIGALLAVLVLCVGTAVRFVLSNVHEIDVPNGYRHQRVTFVSDSGTIAGELLTPTDPGKHPAVTFIVGSDASSYRTNYGRLANEVLSPAFARLGFVILYFDKRGVGKSTGHWETASLEDRARDVAAALRFLKSHPAVDSASVVVVGHSQGGWVVQMLAAQTDNAPAAAISLAGPAVSVLEQMVDDEAGGLMCAGVSSSVARDSASRTVENITRQSIGARRGRLQQLARIREYRPDDALRRIHVPTLLLFGANDRLVPAQTNVGRLHELFGARLPDAIQMSVIPGVAHSFREMELCDQGAQTKRRYPAVLTESITAFLRAHLPSLSPRAAPHPMAQQVRIYRDRFGVPHIYGPTDSSVVFGLAYAESEDGFPQIEENYVRAIGRSAELFGAETLRKDWLNRALQIPELAEREYARLDPTTRSLCDAMAAGINYYLDTHPAEQPRLLRRIKPWYPLALIRYIYFQEGFAAAGGFPVDTMVVARVDDGERESEGSNGWAISPSRSASGHAMLLINPHLPFFGPGQVYEAHVHSGEGWNFTGYTRFGFPVPYVGHNSALGWVSTDNAADVADTYIENFDNPARPLEYRYDGGYRTATTWRDSIAVREAGRLVWRRYTFTRTHHGPVIGANADGRPITLRLSKLDGDGWLRQWHRMTRAQSLGEFREAVAGLDMQFGNFMYADRDGHTWYVYNAAVPRRSPKFDWTRPVDGSTTATEWKGYHDIAELPQLADPSSGWMQNCNGTPFLLTQRESPLSTSFPPYMVREGDNPRSRVSRALLSASGTVNMARLKTLAFDTRVISADSVIPRLTSEFQLISRADGSRAAKLRPVVHLLQQWTRRADTLSVATTLFESVRTKTLSPLVGQTPFTDALEASVSELVGAWGDWRVPWGRVNRLRRGTDAASPSLAVPGVHGALGSVFTFYSAPSSTVASPTRFGTRGATYISVVEFAPKVRAHSIHVFGSSTRSDSPHYFDQAQLYARGQFKPAWFHDAEVFENSAPPYHPGESRGESKQ